MHLEALVGALLGPAAGAALVRLHRDAEIPEAIPDRAELGRDGADADRGAERPPATGQRQQVVDRPNAIPASNTTLSRGCEVVRRCIARTQ